MFQLSYGHPRLMPGIFTVYCTHSICFGYQVMESQESPNVPFTILKTSYPKAPKIVIYDNACVHFTHTALTAIHSILKKRCLWLTDFIGKIIQAARMVMI